MPPAGRELMEPSTLIDWVRDTRERSIQIVDDLDDGQFTVPYLPTINPLLWELCHLAYFMELWVLRQGAGLDPIREDADKLFDSITIDHEERWRLPTPQRKGAYDYVRTVRDRVVELLEKDDVDRKILYYATYSVFHEDMHQEALAYARQTLGYAAPPFCKPLPPGGAAPQASDIAFEGGEFLLGAPEETPFVFDNEKWAHPVVVKPFRISRHAVSQEDFSRFVDTGGYANEDFWSHEGRAWRESVQATRPLFWRRGEEGWERRHFDKWIPLEPAHAMIHVCWYEVEAYCNWAGRRLPTEAEWELSACGGTQKRLQPWGEDVDPNRGNLDMRTSGTVDVGAYGEGDCPAGVRQMMGNVWEWTSSVFAPFPDFAADMYRDYSTTSFYTRRVLRGGCWASRGRMLRTTLRNFYQPYRRDVFAGFRTCALDA